MKRFLEALGLCHTVITDIKQTKEGENYTLYNASSPDELALVNGARHLGFAFDSRDEDGNMVCLTWDGIRKYKLLNVIEFDSTRKRMSVVVKTPEGKILVICKGADSIIEKRLKAEYKKPESDPPARESTNEKKGKSVLSERCAFSISTVDAFSNSLFLL